MQIKTQENKITTLFYVKGELTTEVLVKTFSLTNFRDENNVGKILEEYRAEKHKGNNDFDPSKKRIVLNYIDNKLSLQPQPTPDYIQILGTIDKIRNEIIKKFSQKLLNTVFTNNDIIPDFSAFFNKIDKNLSIKTNDQIENFEYKKPKDFSCAAKNLWIIDDTIDKGRTIEIFLDNLFENNLIDHNSKISVFVLYQNQKKDSIFSNAENVLKDLLNN